MANKANTTSLLEAIRNKLNKFEKNSNSIDKNTDKNASDNDEINNSQTNSLNETFKENITEQKIDNKQIIQKKPEDNPDLDIDDEANHLKNIADKITNKDSKINSVVNFENFEIDFEAQNGVNNYFIEEPEIDIESLKKEIGYIDDNDLNLVENKNVDSINVGAENPKSQNNEQSSLPKIEDPKNIDPIELEILKLEQEIVAKKQKTEILTANNQDTRELKSILDKEFEVAQNEINQEINQITKDHSQSKIEDISKNKNASDGNIIIDNKIDAVTKAISENIDPKIDSKIESKSEIIEPTKINNQNVEEKITKNKFSSQENLLNSQIQKNNSIEVENEKKLNFDNVSSKNIANEEINNLALNNNSDISEKNLQIDDFSSISANENIGVSDNKDNKNQEKIFNFSAKKFNFFNSDKKFSPALDFLNLQKISAENSENQDEASDESKDNLDQSTRNDFDKFTQNEINQSLNKFDLEDTVLQKNAINKDISRVKNISNSEINDSISTNNKKLNDYFLNDNKISDGDEFSMVNNFEKSINSSTNQKLNNINMTNEDDKKNELAYQSDRDSSNVKSLKTNKLDYNIIHEEVAYQAQNSIKKLMEAKNLVGSVNNFVHDQVLTKVAVSLLEPKLEKWLNDNLPYLVEEIVRQEIEKIIPHDDDK